MSVKFQQRSLKLYTDHDWHRSENLMPQFAENYQPTLIESLQAALKYHQTQRDKYVRNVQAMTKLLAPSCVTELSRAVKQSESLLRESLDETLAEDQAKLAHHQDFVDSLRDNISACTTSIPDQQHSELEEISISESTGPAYKLEVLVEEFSDNVTPFGNQLEAIDQWFEIADKKQLFYNVRQREAETQQRIDDIIRLNAKRISLKAREEKKAKTAKFTHAERRRIALNRLWRDLRDINTRSHPSGSVETDFQPAVDKKVGLARLKQSGGLSSDEATREL